MWKRLLPLLLLAVAVRAAEPPQAELTNGILRARLYLPDARDGYYQGTRFDWSGVISSLTYKGHEYFGPWFERYNPKTHDAITGPVEEFLLDTSCLGYEDAKAGGTFPRIGVGNVRKPEEKGYQRFRSYEIVDPGTWEIRKGKQQIEFTHRLKGDSGYAFVYTKKVRLEPGRPVMVLEHSLRNTGTRPIETQQYNHNFFTIDGQPTGPDFAVRFPFAVRSLQDLKGIARVENNSLVYLRELETGQSLLTELQGFGPEARDYDFRIENRKAGAGVRIRGDQPLDKIIFWCIRKTLCPEPYVRIRVAPGKTVKWTLRYDFYTLP